jgi:phosphonate transport system substrate-binding protein
MRSHLLTALMLPVLVAAQALAADLVIALKPDKNPEAMLQERSALTAYLAAKLGRPVTVIVPLSAAVIQEGLANGTVDLGYVSGTEMVRIIDAKAGDLLLAGEIAGKTSYESFWVARADSTATSIADLKGKPIAFASRTSTSGMLMPLLDLVEKGLVDRRKPDPETFFGAGNVIYGTGYLSGIERVLAGQADAAAVSDYVMLQDKHLTPEQKAKLKIIQRQGPVPTHCLAVRAGMSAEERQSLTAAITAMDSDAAQLSDKVFTSKLVPVDAAAHLATVRAALALVSAK